MRIWMLVGALFLGACSTSGRMAELSPQQDRLTQFETINIAPEAVVKQEDIALTPEREAEAIAPQSASTASDESLLDAETPLEITAEDAVPAASTPIIVEVEVQEDVPETQTLDPVNAKQPSSRRGLLGMFGRSSRSGLLNPSPVVAAPAVDTVSEPVVAEGGARSETGITSLVPFGEMRKVCGVSASELGAVIGEESGFTLYDSGGGQTLRSHYLTGFRDRCARQFSASLVMFGDVGTHEIVRYQTRGVDVPYSPTDLAYENLKAEICGAGRGEPCGAKLDRLARKTTFVTAYGTFEGADHWANALLHRGQLLAISQTEL